MSQFMSDEQMIIQAALDYANGSYLGDGDQMARALHPELAKRAIFKDKNTGADTLHFLSAGELIAWAGEGQGKQPENRRQQDVQILDRFSNAACVRLDMNDWVDYLQVGKVDGRWVIINVLWALKEKQG